MIEAWSPFLSIRQEKLEQRKILGPLTITDLPIHIFEMITDKLEKNCRFTLRHVCKSFRALVDTWDPGYKKISICIKPNYILMIYDGKVFCYRYIYNDAEEFYSKHFMEKAIDDFISIVKHPNLNLTNFDFKEEASKGNITKLFLGKLIENVELSDAKFGCDSLELECRSISDLQVVKLFQPGGLKCVKVGNDSRHVQHIPEEISKILEEIGGLEQLKQAEQITFNPTITRYDSLLSIPKFVKCPKIIVIFNAIRENRESLEYVKILLQSSTLKICELMSARLHMTTATKKKLGAKTVPDRPSILIYPIPGSEEFFEIEIDPTPWRLIRIERKKII